MPSYADVQSPFGAGVSAGMDAAKDIQEQQLRQRAQEILQRKQELDEATHGYSTNPAGSGPDLGGGVKAGDVQASVNDTLSHGVPTNDLSLVQKLRMKVGGFLGSLGQQPQAPQLYKTGESEAERIQRLHDERSESNEAARDARYRDVESMKAQNALDVENLRGKYGIEEARLRAREAASGHSDQVMSALNAQAERYHAYTVEVGSRLARLRSDLTADPTEVKALSEQYDQAQRAELEAEGALSRYTGVKAPGIPQPRPAPAPEQIKGQMAAQASAQYQKYLAALDEARKIADPDQRYEMMKKVNDHAERLGIIKRDKKE